MDKRLGMLAWGCWLLAGCADRSADRYVPSPETGRWALEACLQAWREGRPPGAVPGTSPGVFLVDSCRRPGQQLDGYTILGEAPGEGPRCFAVRLSLRNPTEEQRARFVLVGIDPLWVYRHEDYEMMIHWQCAEEPGARDQPASPKKR
jgi:hypothetical protein